MLYWRHLRTMNVSVWVQRRYGSTAENNWRNISLIVGTKLFIVLHRGVHYPSNTLTLGIHSIRCSRRKSYILLCRCLLECCCFLDIIIDVTNCHWFSKSRRYLQCVIWDITAMVLGRGKNTLLLESILWDALVLETSPGMSSGIFLGKDAIFLSIVKVPCVLSVGLDDIKMPFLLDIFLRTRVTIAVLNRKKV